MLCLGVLRSIGPCFLAFMILMGAAVTKVSADDGRRTALVIGNGTYGYLPGLKNPARDATLIAIKLRSVGFDVDLAINETRAGLERRVQSFGKRAENASVALFYFAGHGIQEAGHNYLLPVDAAFRKASDLSHQSLSMSTVSAALDEANAKVNLILLDACRDNPLPRLLAGRSETRSAKAAKGLASMDRASGTLIAYATAPGDVAYDGDGMLNSPFTQAVADWIEEPGLEIEPMFRRIREQVIAATDGRQVPWIEHAILGNFYFKPVLPESTVVAALPTEKPLPLGPGPAVDAAPKQVQPPRLQESLPARPGPDDPADIAWSKTEELDTRDAYVAFLKNHPDSSYAREAMAKLLQFASLGAPAALPSTPPPAPAKPAPTLPAAIAAPQQQQVEPPSLQQAPPPLVLSDRIETAWSQTTALGTRHAYLAFLKQFPNSIRAKNAMANVIQSAAPTVR